MSLTSDNSTLLGTSRKYAKKNTKGAKKARHNKRVLAPPAAGELCAFA